MYSHYSHTHYEEHLIITRNILEQTNPAYLEAYDRIMKKRSGHMFNMFIMSKSLSDAYCEWLFPIIDELYKKMDITGYSAFDARLFGRVSERLLNVWLLKLNLKVVEVPFMYMEKVNLWHKGKSFLEAKFLGKKYGKSF